MVDNPFQAGLDFIKAGRLKYVVTDPCYLLSDDEWDQFNNFNHNRRVWTKKPEHERKMWDRMTELGYNNGLEYEEYQMSLTFDFSLISLPRRFGEINITHAAHVPMGDIYCSYKGQSFGFDSGTVCIAEVPLDWTIPVEEGRYYNDLVAIYEDYHDAERAMLLALAWEFVREEDTEDLNDWAERMLND